MTSMGLKANGAKEYARCVDKMTAIRVMFYEITNNRGSLYGRFRVLSPCLVQYDDSKVDLTKLDGLSASLNYGVYIGSEQDKGSRDSLYVALNETRTWPNGHAGYFDLTDCLSDEVREALGVDGDWDAEWDAEDILTRNRPVQEITPLPKMDSKSNEPKTEYLVLEIYTPNGLRINWGYSVQAKNSDEAISKIPEALSEYGRDIMYVIVRSFLDVIIKSRLDISLSGVIDIRRI